MRCLARPPHRLSSWQVRPGSSPGQLVRILVLAGLVVALPAQGVESACRAVLAARPASAAGVSAAVVLPDATVVAVAAGKDAAGGELTPASVFLSGSIGKTYCAAIALQLVHEGKLELDAKVAAVLGMQAWYARIANHDTITLRQLLNHTSGIREHVWKPEFQKAVAACGDRAMTPVESLAFALDDPPANAPGEAFAYADTNYLLVGLCIEAVTQKPFADVLRTRLLEPLQLAETGPNDRRDLPHLACGMAAGIGFHDGPTVTAGRYFTHPAFEYCGGGVHSTARDLARWTRALFAGDVVPEELRKDHTTPVAAPRHVLGGYGLGCFVGRTELGPALGHSGVMPGFLSYALYYPDQTLAVAVHTPTDDGRAAGNLRRLCDDLARAALEALAKPK